MPAHVVGLQCSTTLVFFSALYACLKRAITEMNLTLFLSAEVNSLLLFSYAV